ncbi:glycosyltransferase [Lactobacillus sp. PV012]|uniref:glycosyltransferase n=1 Tax=Lactobacillus sp. PV012 TaxID=2594494 RepID=UPI00223EBBD5|nr:glycosyltransferase [Lactobacillus sp. PV012]QNQ82771.1 glycosyltransferase [Lactobacillus sp. PV012]
MNKAKLGIVVVTYNPNINDFYKNMKIISTLSNNIVIVDNNSNDQIYRGIEQLKESYSNLSIIRLSENKGIGYAQNIGIEYLNNKVENYYLFLDQDSSITLFNLKKLIKIFEKINDQNVVAIGPAQDYDVLNNHVEKTDKLISSGSLVKKAAFEKIGKYKSAFFIDYIDYEWCWRAQKQGYKVYKTDLVEMNHETTGVNRYRGHTVDPIFRLYYIFRNSTYLVLYEKIPIKAKIVMIVRNSGKLMFQFRLPKKKLRIKSVMKGIKDGLRKQLG